MKRLFFLLIIIHFLHCLDLQGQVILNINRLDSTDIQESIEDFKQYNLATKESIASKLDSMKSAYRKKGYLGFAIDSISMMDSVSYANVYVGYQYRFQQVQVDSAEQVLLDEIRYQNKNLNSLLLTDNNISYVTEKILGYLENNGYPFAGVRFDSLLLNKGEVKARLNIDRNQLILIDSIQVTGPVKISKSYLEKYLGVKSGDLYDNSEVIKIPQKLKNVRFLSLAKSPSVLFVNQKAVINIETKRSKSSSFDFLIGLQRNSVGEGSQYIITGEFTTELLNKLGHGESMFVQFKRLKPETQELNLRANYPYPFDMPFGVDGSFELYRNALDFLDLNAALGLRYIWDGNSHLKMFYNQSSNYLLEIDSSAILTSLKLPSRLDVSYNSLGLELQHSSLDYQFNPSKGLYLNVSSQAGIKKIIDNNKIVKLNNEFVDFSNAYDTLSLRTYQFQLNNDIAYYFPLSDNLSFKVANKGGFKFSGADIFQNEYFRIGGNKLLRGFDEQSVFATFYSVFSFELRFILAQENNNFTLSLPFVDYGIVHNPLDISAKWDQPLGVGVGMNFETQAGLFNFAIASGQRDQLPFDFNNMKIHFGYINVF